MIYEPNDAYAGRMLQSKLVRIDRRGKRMTWTRLLCMVLLLVELWWVVGVRRMAVVTVLAMAGVVLFAAARKAWR